MNTRMFIKKYNSKGIEDDGAYVSPQFKAFARDFKLLAHGIGAPVGAQVVNFLVGHYDVSGFLKRGDKCCYFSYSVPRGNAPLNCDARDPMNGILVRSAKDEHDYSGGSNRFCNFSGFGSLVESLLK